jgi:hypothetical protein
MHSTDDTAAQRACRNVAGPYLRAGPGAADALGLVQAA